MKLTAPQMIVKCHLPFQHVISLHFQYQNSNRFIKGTHCYFYHIKIDFECCLNLDFHFLYSL